MITKTNYFVISDPNLQVQKENGPGGQPENIGVDFMFRIPTKRTFFGFGLDPEITGDGRMSDQVVSLSFVDSEGNVLGSIELSEGPAYGQQILERVALGWTIASVVAVFLAAGVGWLISRRISQPLLSLTAVTDKMAHGNLSVRANVARQDELGTLATVFNEMAQQVEDTVVTLRRFVADAAHEINTPLTALQTNLELIANEEDGADRRTFVAQAQIQMERLAALTTGLLELSRIEANMVKEKYVPLDLIALVQETSELYASRAEQAGLSFSLEIRPEPVTIWGDKTQLRLAIGNLLDNALKFTPTGGLVRVVVHQKGQWAELQIEDTGIGIPAEDLPQLFHRFHRGHNAAGYPGSGLGLAIVKAVVDGHGGQVITENTAQGACFSLQLPIV
jgi:signal transduction histidine kinase